MNFQTIISQCYEILKLIEEKIIDLKSLKQSYSDAYNEDMQNLSNKENNISNYIFEKKSEIDKNINLLTNEIENNENNINKLKSEIKQLDKDNNDIQSKKIEINNKELELRGNKILLTAFIKKYQNIWNKYAGIKNDINEIKNNKVVNDAEIALGRSLTGKEKNEIIEDPKIIQQIYEERIHGTPPLALINAVKDLEERHKEIKKLEKSLLHMHQMIIEINKLVKYQGEIIDNIADNVSKSKDWIEKGEITTKKGYECMKCGYNIKCIITWIIVAILLIIIIPIILKFF